MEGRDSAQLLRGIYPAMTISLFPPPFFLFLNFFFPPPRLPFIYGYGLGDLELAEGETQTGHYGFLFFFCESLPIFEVLDRLGFGDAGLKHGRDGCSALLLLLFFFVRALFPYPPASDRQLYRGAWGRDLSQR